MFTCPVNGDHINWLFDGDIYKPYIPVIIEYYLLYLLYLMIHIHNCHKTVENWLKAEFYLVFNSKSCESIYMLIYTYKHLSQLPINIKLSKQN